MKVLSAAAFGVLLCATSVIATPDTAEFKSILSDIFTIRAKEEDPSVVIKQYKCILNVLESVSKTAGLEALWASSAPSFASNIERWQKCSRFVSGPGFLCHVQETSTAYLLVTDYLASATAKDPIFYFRFIPKYVKQCAWPQRSPSVETVSIKEADDLARYVLCRMFVVADALSETEYLELWKDYQKQVGQKVQDIANCRKQPIKNIAQCIVTEVNNISTIFAEFMVGLYTINVDLVEHIKELIEENCGAEAVDKFPFIELSNSN